MATKLSQLLPIAGVFALVACSDMNGPTDLPGESGETSHVSNPPIIKDTTPMAPPAPPAPAPPAGSPLAGGSLYVEPTSRALTTASQWQSTRPADAPYMTRIGRTPQAVWFNGWQSDTRAAASAYTTAAAQAGQWPVLVAYNIPQRDCGSYSAGGVGSADAYRAWIRDLAAGIGSRRAVVILEPDALAGMSCLSATDRARRLQLLGEAVDILKGNAQTLVYLDAGHARWLSAAEAATRLSSANIARADGFSLNVSNFISSAENVSYGEAVSARVGGKHFIIDTSRNGMGATSTNEWCNPDGRGLGIAPTTATGHPLVDALLWIKRPGESDGSCNGGPVAGAWWPEYALGLAQRATVVVALNN